MHMHTGLSFGRFCSVKNIYLSLGVFLCSLFLYKLFYCTSGLAERAEFRRTTPMSFSPPPLKKSHTPTTTTTPTPLLYAKSNLLFLQVCAQVFIVSFGACFFISTVSCLVELADWWFFSNILCHGISFISLLSARVISLD